MMKSTLIALGLTLLVAPSLCAQAEDTSAYVFDLRPIFASEEAWEAEREAVRRGIAAIGSWKGRAGRDASSLASALDDAAALRRRAARMAIYGVLVSGADTRSERARMQSETGLRLEGEVESAVAFIEEEVRALGAERIRAWERQEPRLADHRQRLHRIVVQAQHTPPLEARSAVEALRRWQSTSDVVWEALMGSDLGWPRVQGADGSPMIINLPAFTRLSTSANTEVRRRDMRAFLEKLRSLDSVFASLLTRRVEAELAIARQRRFAHGAEMFLARDGFRPQTHEVMLEVMLKNTDVFQRYFEQRRKLLGLDRLTLYDLRAPLPAALPRITVPEAIELTIGAAAPLGQPYQQRLRARLQEPWIHLASTPDKGSTYGVWYTVGNIPPRGIMTWNSNSISSSNFAGLSFMMMLFADVPMTPGPDTRHDPPVFVNTIGDSGRMLHDDHLRSRAQSRQERIAYLVRSLDLVRSLFYRNGLTAAFENSVHRRVAAGESLGGEALSTMYQDLLKRFYPSVEIDEAFRAEWMTHSILFYGSDAQGFPLATSAAALMVERLRAGDARAVAAFTSMLGRGESDFSHDLLKQAGIDLTSPEPYQALIRRVRALVDELDQLIAQGQN